ncbi:MAG: alpha-galactosidase, partial [Clostridia bacterium]|nr:alpha-galactosidase [Clostridia bacterium]
QKNLLGYLEPGESIRTPLVSLTFYNNDNPVKGFNAFRSWIMDCVYPENVPTVQNNMDILFVSNTRTADEIFYDLEQFDKTKYPYLDNYWMDAGWYAGCEESWADGVGNWKTSETRFPGGIKAIADYGAENGVGVVLWYEPERLTSNSYLYSVGSQHENWLVDLDPKADFNQNVMWNLGDEEACAFLSDYIASSLIENGVAVYRQDFNFSPTEYWQHQDLYANGGRIGFAENHYITGLYAYLDGLFATVPDLVMDNCASGGRRLDLEMTRRSVPMWRSDYNCDQTLPDLLDATQAHTYGLSFWLPVSGTFINFDTEYGMRSSIMPILQVPMATPVTALDGYRAEREAQMQNFFPLSFGGTDPKKITAMQYGDKTAGCALIYAHAEHEADSFTVYFSGLQEDAVYTVTDADTPDTVVSFSGSELMAGAYSVSFPEGRKAVVLNYTIA